MQLFGYVYHLVPITKHPHSVTLGSTAGKYAFNWVLGMADCVNRNLACQEKLSVNHAYYYYCSCELKNPKVNLSAKLSIKRMTRYAEIIINIS